MTHPAALETCQTLGRPNEEQQQRRNRKKHALNDQGNDKKLKNPDKRVQTLSSVD